MKSPGRLDQHPCEVRSVTEASPPAEAPAYDAVVDSDVLAMLEAHFGQASTAAFAEMFQVQAERLDGALDGGQCEVIAREAHSMASSAGTLGLVELEGVCREVMLASRLQPQAVLDLVPRLRAATRRGAAALARRFG
jgi:HPt (histidine-containing phosphotransfer) domain-containing protein